MTEKQKTDQINETKLTMWFASNRKFPNAGHLKYDQFPSCFRWVRNDEKWMPRQSMLIKKIPRASYKQEVENYENYEFNFTTSQKIGRMYNLSLKEGKRYYLRLMLTQIPGAMSFEDIRTFDDVVYEYYEESDTPMVLFNDDRNGKGHP